MCKPLFYALSLIVLLSASSGYCQQANIYTMFPTNAMVDVGTDATIVIRATMPVIQSSVSVGYPDANELGYTPHQPTVVLLPEKQAKRLDPSRWAKYTTHGKYQLTDGRTVQFKPYRLIPNTEYRCVVSDVFLESPQGMVRADALDFTFTTSNHAPVLLASTPDSMSVVKCTQPLFFQFSSSEIEMADVVRILRIEQKNSEDGRARVPIPTQIVADPIRNAYQVMPIHSWEAGKNLHVTLDLGNITGDSQENREWIIPVRNGAKVIVNAVAADGRVVPSYIQEILSTNNVVASHEEPLALVSPDAFGNRWQFVRWEGPGLTQPSTCSKTHVTISCELLSAEMNFSAIVERIDTIVQVVKIDGEGSVVVTNGEGELVKTITDTDTLYITDDAAEFRLMAVPALGNTFTSWSGVQGGQNISAAPAIVVNAGTLFGPNTLVGLGPNQQTANFGPIVPKYNYEIYRVRGTLSDVDADPMFNINDAVAFTTAMEFEDAQPGSRALCVKTQPCWEIIGYAISASNKVEFFEPGVGEYCVQANLTDPENVVTFFGRRRRVALRIERVMLNSDDPTDIIKGAQPHQESRITIQKKAKLFNGAIGWKTVNQHTCMDNETKFGGGLFQCGDELRLACSGSEIRGEKWKFFGQPINYLLPDGGDKQGREYVYNMIVQMPDARFAASECNGGDDIPEIRVQGCFEQQFGIDAISIRVRLKNGENRADSRFAERWLDPMIYYDELPDEPVDGRQLQYIPRRGTHIKVRFTTPIDTRTIFAGGMELESVGNKLVTDPRLGGLDFSVASFDGQHINFYPKDGTPVTTVEFAACDPRTSPRMQALHFGILDLTCLKTIKSLAGKPLLENSSFGFNTIELPGIGYHLKSIDYAFDGDVDFILPNYGETYQVVYGANMAADRAYQTHIGFKRIPDCREQQGDPVGECTIPHSDKNGPQLYGEKLLWIEPYWMDKRDKAYVHIVSYDEDCKDKNDCLVNRVYDLLDEVRERAESYQSKDKTDAVEWRTVIPDLINVGARFIQGLIAPDDQDEYLGEFTHFAGMETLWGMNAATSPNLVFKHPNSTYTLIGRLYVSTAVVR